MSEFNFLDFAVTGSAARAGVSIKDLSVEAARAEVIVYDSNTKKPVEGAQGLALKLGRIKMNLDALSKGAVKFQVPNEQVEAVSAQLLAAVEAGKLDAAIEEVLVRLNTAPVAKSAAEPAADLEGFDEDEFDTEA